MVDKSIRPDLGIGTRQAWCDKCTCHFISSEAFDIHRGITKHRLEAAQDAGRCVWPNKLLAYKGRWGTADDVNTVKRMELARVKRDRG